MILFFYNLALLLALVVGAPWWLWRMATARKYREGLAERLGLGSAALSRRLEGLAGKPLIWVHAVSVGEVLAVSRLVKELDEALPGFFVAISTTTSTGQALARERFGEGRVFYCPLDLPWAVRAHLDALDPRLLVLAETEFWPNLLSNCFRRGIPIAVVNARVSDRSWPRYRRLRGLWRPFLERLSRVLAQSETDAERLVAIGCAAERVSVAGNLKFDVRATGEVEAARILKALRGGLRLVVAGSTLEGEEAALLEAWPRLLEADLRLVLVLAPRHPERFAAVAELVEASGYPWNRRTHWQHQPAGAIKLLKPGQIVLLDSIGELASVYSVAAVAFVGGSLVEAGGHNPLEPAQFGVPTVMGPHYANFRAIAEDLRAHEGLRIAQPDDLAEVLADLLLDRAAAQALGDRARAAFEQQAGATARCVEAILELVADAAPAAGAAEKYESPNERKVVEKGPDFSPAETATAPGPTPHDTKSLDFPRPADRLGTGHDLSRDGMPAAPDSAPNTAKNTDLPRPLESFGAGHDFSRAETPAHGNRALAPAEAPVSQTLESAQPLSNPSLERGDPPATLDTPNHFQTEIIAVPSEAAVRHRTEPSDPQATQDAGLLAPAKTGSSPTASPSTLKDSGFKEIPLDSPIPSPSPEIPAPSVPTDAKRRPKSDGSAASPRTLLKPLIPAYRIGLWMRERRLGTRAEPVRKLRWPVVSIGNLSTGGAGKTPLTIALAKALDERGFHVDVLSRGYGRKSEFALRVAAEGTAEEFGDEPLLIAREAGVPVYVAPQRFDAGRLAEADAAAIAFLGEQLRPVVHLLDDGFQHRQLARDVDILLLDRADWEDALLPAGNLREPLSAIHRASVVAVPANDTALEDELRAWGWKGPVWRVQRTMEMMPAVQGAVLAFCGIARPQQFFAGLEADGLQIAVRKAFADHSTYKASNLERLLAEARAAGAVALVTTEKDRVRLGTMASLFPQDLPLITARLQSQILSPILSQFEDQQGALDWLAARLQTGALHPAL